MSRADRRLQRYIDALLRDRRPRRGRAGDDAGAMRLAARLRAAHPGTADPSPAYVDSLARRLRQDAADDRPAMPQRRRFLAAAGAAAAAGIGAGIGIEHLRAGNTIPPQPVLQPTDGQWVAVARMADLKMGTVKRFSSNGIEGFVLNANGRLSGLSAVCTDQGCILQADRSGKHLNCPCHYAQFELDGLPKPGAYHPVTPLPVIQTRANGNDVEAFLPVEKRPTDWIG